MGVLRQDRIEKGLTSLPPIFFHVLHAGRLRMAARALRLGYNLLFLDTDIIIFDEPYKYFKSPLFADVNVIVAGVTYA